MPKRKPHGITKADKESQKSEDLIKRDFTAEAPLEKCITDITEIKAADGKLYVSAIFDCFDVAVVGLAMADNMRADLCVETLVNAYRTYPDLRGCIIHSDRGSQYTSEIYRNAISKYGIIQSMNSAGGRCHDNARCESMWARMKEELLYGRYNKINVISRKDIDNLYEHHVLHSMAIAKAINFRPGTEILDFGCGGGFPGIPLAILFPECKFKLIDGTGKKIRVCNEVASAIGLKNLVAEHLRGEEEKGKYDFVVSRAVMQLPDLMKIIKKNFKKKGQNALPNGLICLKGGNLQEELKDYRNVAEITPLSTFFEEEWFKQDKQLIYVPA